MGENRSVGPHLFHTGEAPDVINVAVCDPHGFERCAESFDFSVQRARLRAGVNEHNAARPGIVEKPGVLLERPDGQGVNLYHAGVGMSIGIGAGAGCPLFRAVRNFSTAIAAVVASPTAVVT